MTRPWTTDPFLKEGVSGDEEWGMPLPNPAPSELRFLGPLIEGVRRLLARPGLGCSVAAGAGGVAGCLR